MDWLQDHGWVVGLLVAAALALAGLAGWSARRRPSATPVPGAAARRRVDLTFAAAVLVTLTVGRTLLLLVERVAGLADTRNGSGDASTYLRATSQSIAARVIRCGAA